MNDEIEFLQAGKHESLLQADTMILMEMVRHFQNFQNSKFIMSVQYLKKEVRNEVEFCIQIITEAAYKLISTLWAPK